MSKINITVRRGIVSYGLVRSPPLHGNDHNSVCSIRPWSGFVVPQDLHQVYSRKDTTIQIHPSLTKGSCAVVQPRSAGILFPQG